MRKSLIIVAAIALAAVGCGRSGRTFGEHTGDAWVATKTRLHLMQHGFGQQMNINIDVMRGVVTLKGEVHDEAAKARAETLVREVVGVRDVRNELRVVAEDMTHAHEPGRRWQERRAPPTAY